MPKIAASVIAVYHAGKRFPGFYNPIWVLILILFSRAAFSLLTSGRDVSGLRLAMNLGLLQSVFQRCNVPESAPTSVS